MTLPDVVPIDTTPTVSVSFRLRHRCPFVDEVDDGDVDISWRCNGSTIELHSLRHWLIDWGPCQISHEEITESIANNLGALDGIEDVRVVTYWKTAGMSVTVTGGADAIHGRRPGGDLSRHRQAISRDIDNCADLGIA